MSPLVAFTPRALAEITQSTTVVNVPGLFQEVCFSKTNSTSRLNFLEACKSSRLCEWMQRCTVHFVGYEMLKLVFFFKREAVCAWEFIYVQLGVFVWVHLSKRVWCVCVSVFVSVFVSV